MDVREYVRLMMTEIQTHLSGSGQLAFGRSTLHRRLGELAMKRWVGAGCLEVGLAVLWSGRYALFGQVV